MRELMAAHPGGVHKTTVIGDPAAALPLPARRAAVSHSKVGARTPGPPRNGGLGDQIADVVGGELPHYDRVHDVLLTGSLRVGPANGYQD